MSAITALAAEAVKNMGPAQIAKILERFNATDPALQSQIMATFALEVNLWRQAAESCDSIGDLAIDQALWSQATFGADDGDPSGSLQHLLKEVNEAIKAQHDIVEYADMLILLLDASRRAGFGLGQLVNAAKDKMVVNKARKWPPKVKGVPCEHIREEVNGTQSEDKSAVIFPAQFPQVLAGSPTLAGPGGLDASRVQGLPGENEFERGQQEEQVQKPAVQG